MPPSRGVSREPPGVRKEAWNRLSLEASGGTNTPPHPHLDLRLPASRTRDGAFLLFAPLGSPSKGTQPAVYFLNIHIRSALRLKEHWLMAEFCDKSLCDVNHDSQPIWRPIFLSWICSEWGRAEAQFPSSDSEATTKGCSPRVLITLPPPFSSQMFSFRRKAWGKG